MEHALGFTTTEFMRLQQQVTHLMKIKKELEAELAIWKPAISVDTITDTAGNPAVSYTAQYGKDGMRRVFTAQELSTCQAEELADIVHRAAEHTARLKTGMIKEMIIPFMQRAADYSKTVYKVKGVD